MMQTIFNPRPIQPKPERPPARGTQEWRDWKRKEARQRADRRLANEKMQAWGASDESRTILRATEGPVG